MSNEPNRPLPVALAAYCLATFKGYTAQGRLIHKSDLVPRCRIARKVAGQFDDAQWAEFQSHYHIGASP